MYKLADGTNSTDYKIGDRFEVVKKDTFTVGSIVELYGDGEDDCPLFKLITGNTFFKCCAGEPGAYTWWKDVKSVSPVDSTINEAITTLQSLISYPEITLEVSDDTVCICVWGRKFATAGEDVEAVLETVNMLVGQEIPQ